MQSSNPDMSYFRLKHIDSYYYWQVIILLYAQISTARPDIWTSSRLIPAQLSSL